MTHKLQQLPLDLKFAPAMGREDFVVSESNRYAVHMIESWPQGWAPFPALTIYGPKGSGKSHLAAVWQSRSQARLINAEEFRNCDISALLEARVNLVIDQLEQLIGHRDQEEKLFHLYNGFKQEQLYLLGLSDKSPEHLTFLVQDLASRLRASQSAEIKAPDDDLLRRVLVKRFIDQNLDIGEDGINYILIRMERDWDALDKLVNDIRLAATVQKRADVTIPLLRSVLAEHSGDD